MGMLSSTATAHTARSFIDDIDAELAKTDNDEVWQALERLRDKAAAVASAADAGWD